ncbi:DUF2254 domain-containing protein [Pontibacillus sp. ALD_SL1]|uniref:DUF2254 domain-containing protein n=1 Tax=Pontibacillus sp. ALD_SL1 TaxID=2777185 RepID=UPI001A972032|nr:DUF2254 domain-containing protein [Pontibacillus sp. ALD_SL1]QSS98637.1 DUF2254 domain-containing protein [Pontibacillus sp. ALD_SL1]
MSLFGYIKKYGSMSRRQRKTELNSTLWFMPLWYIAGAILLSIFTFYLDYILDVGSYLPVGLGFSGTTLQVLLSALVGGVLTLSAFTINSLLVALTTFSGQFSSKMLVNFVSDKMTQHVLGIFNGSFIYVLLNFLYVTHEKEEYIFATPILSILTAIIAALTFVYFINHTTTWMQVHNISFNMNKKSKSVQESLIKEEEPFILDYEDGRVQKLPDEEGNTMLAPKTGYVQLADIAQIVQEAERDGATVKLEAGIGEFVLSEAPLLTIWSKSNVINDEKYLGFIEIGEKQTEIQDLEYGVNKLAEVAIKAIGNNDPLTVSNTLHQITDLLKSIGKQSNFSPYLGDREGNLRFILDQKDFSFYLHKGFAHVREYANNNTAILSEILRMTALLAKVLPDKLHKDLWEFAYETVLGLQDCQLHRQDCYTLLDPLYKISRDTGEVGAFQSVKENLLCTIRVDPQFG